MCLIFLAFISSFWSDVIVAFNVFACLFCKRLTGEQKMKFVANILMV